MVDGHVFVKIQVILQVGKRLLIFGIQAHDFHGHHGFNMR